MENEPLVMVALINELLGEEGFEAVIAGDQRVYAVESGILELIELQGLAQLIPQNQIICSFNALESVFDLRDQKIDYDINEKHQAWIQHLNNQDRFREDYSKKQLAEYGYGAAERIRLGLTNFGR